MTVYVVWHFGRGYLVDTCAGGTWHGEETEATWFTSVAAAEEAVTAAELGELEVDYEIRPIVTQPG